MKSELFINWNEFPGNICFTSKSMKSKVQINLKGSFNDAVLAVLGRLLVYHGSQCSTKCSIHYGPKF